MSEGSMPDHQRQHKTKEHLPEPRTQKTVLAACSSNFTTAIARIVPYFSTQPNQPFVQKTF
jgi:hypothetical protein